MNTVLEQLNCGDVFRDCIGDKHIVVRKEGEKVYVLRKELLPEMMEFGESNDWRTSAIREYLHGEYLNVLKNRFGEDNILPHETNLLSLDGLKNYESIVDMVSLMTLDDYRLNRDVIGENIGCQWWLATADSTPSGCGAGYVLHIGQKGDVTYDDFFCAKGVRPFFALKSSTIVFVD